MSSYRSLKMMMFAAALGVLAGCGVQPETKSGTMTQASFTGKLHGGQQAVADATLQLYTVGTYGDGSTATPVLVETVRTGSDGSFSLTGLYDCSDTTEMYITATGGSPGAFGNNPNLAMMTALGPCSNLGPNTYLTINEVTTVAAVAALAPYMSSRGQVGSASTDAAALANAFTLAEEFADSGSGASPGLGVPSGYTVPTAEINTLADVVAACVNSTGGTAGDGTVCGRLFAAATPAGGTAPRNTIIALLNVMNNPTSNATTLFNLVPPSVPFQPLLSRAPTTFSVALQQ